MRTANKVERDRFNNALYEFASVCGVGIHTVMASLMMACETIEQEKFLEEYGRRVQRELKSLNHRMVQRELKSLNHRMFEEETER